MSTSPTPQPQQDPLHLLLSDVHENFSSLAHKTMSLSYGLVAVLVLVLGLAGMGGFAALRAFQAQEAKAQAQEQLYKAQLDQFKASLAQDEAQRKVDAQKITDLQAGIVKRASTPPPPVISDGLIKGAAPNLVIKSLIAAYGPEMSPSALPDGTIALSVANTQETISAKVDLDHTKADLQDTKSIVGLQIGTISSLNNNLQQCKDTLDGANKTIVEYKKAANKTRFRRFLDGAVKYVGPVVGIVIGYQLHR